MNKNSIPVGAAVYFDSPTSPAAGHVGLYIGGNQVIHAFGKVKLMTVDAIIGAGYAWQGWGWNGGVKPSGAGATVSTSSSGSGGSSGSSLADEAVVHVPQTEQVWTAYENDSPGKKMDDYRYYWNSHETGITREITDRVGDPTLEDDSDSLCVTFSFNVFQSGERFLQPLKLEPGDAIAVKNTGSGRTVFLGQIESMSGSYRDSMSYTALDGGRKLTTNEIILQFNNVPAKEAIGMVAGKVGLSLVSCPNLVSSVYEIMKTSASEMISKILETVTAENGVVYFPRVIGSTLVIRSYAATCIRGWYKQEYNLAAFDILDEASEPRGSWSIEDLRNQVVVYSEKDDAATVLATEEDKDSVLRYGRRTALETYSDEDKVTAGAKAGTRLAQLNQVQEEFSTHCFGSDQVVAGCRLRLDLAEAQGEFWVTRVTHKLGPPHTMDLTLRRAL